MRQVSAKLDEQTARSPLLLIDDDVDNSALLERILEWAGYTNVHTCTNGKRGLELMESLDPHLIILDLNMPGINGYEFLEIVRATNPAHSFLPILIYSADVSSEAKIRALEAGASDFLTKPGDSAEIQLRLRNFLRARRTHNELQMHNELLEAKVKERIGHLETSRREAVQILARISEFRDDDTGEHAHRVGELSANIARHMNGVEPRFVECLRLAAPLHDIGKIALPDNILYKTDIFSDEDMELMKTHVDAGALILADQTSPLLVLAKEIVANHHERWDGSGYPRGLSGEGIPLSARIVGLADTFDAITTDRPYRQAKTLEEALEVIEALSGIHFDPTVVVALTEYYNSQLQNELKAA